MKATSSENIAMNDTCRHMNYSSSVCFNRVLPDKVKPEGILEWMLAILMLGAFTVSYIEGLSGAMVIFAALMAGSFFVYFLYQRLSLELPPELIAYYCWIIWSLGGLTNVRDINLFYRQFFVIIQMGFLISIVTMIMILKRKMSMVMLLNGIGAISVALSAYFLSGYDEGRASGYLDNANEFAYAILYSLFAVAYFWGRKRSLWWRTVLSGIVAISFASILLSGSRKGFLTAVLFVFLWWLFSQSRTSVRRPLSKLAILAFLLIGVYVAVDFMMPYTPLGKRFEERALQHSEGRRLTMYKEGLDIIKKYPIFGIGLNNYRTLSSTFQYSHSDFIEVASNTGMVGFMFYYSIYVFLWVRLHRLKKMIADRNTLDTIIILQIAIILILICGLGTVHIKSKITWLFLSSVIGYSWSLNQTVSVYKRMLRCATEAPIFSGES